MAEPSGIVHICRYANFDHLFYFLRDGMLHHQTDEDKEIVNLLEC